MMINKENYELYAIDFLEDNLDKETKAEMILFLNNHPDIHEELKLMKSPVLMSSDNTITFEPKSLLKKEDKQKAVWIPIFIKYAAAIVLLLSVGSVWHLNNQDSLINDAVATIDATNSNQQIKTEIKKESIIENTTIAEIDKPISQTNPSQSKIYFPKIPKQLNHWKKEITRDNNEENKPLIATTIQEPISSQINRNNLVSENETKAAPNNSATNYKRIEHSTAPIDLMAQTNLKLSNGSISDGINLTPPPSVTIDKTTNRPKGSWLLNALTKKSDGTKIFAFEGVKRALTPIRLRDVNVDKASTDSPFKQFTHD